MRDLKEKILEEREILVIGLFFGFLFGISLSLTFQQGETSSLSKKEVANKTEKFINDVLGQGGKNTTVQYTNIEDSGICGVYNVTLKVEQTNFSSSVLVTKDGEWLLQKRKLS